jgi:hypothetical protein
MNLTKKWPTNDLTKCVNVEVHQFKVTKKLYIIIVRLRKMVKIVDLKNGSLRFFFLEIYRSKIDLGKGLL